jgi:hypothetical protein
MKPVARKNGLVVRDLADEVVVYDKERHEAHCLNGTAATVFRNADGQRSVSDLAVLLGADGPGAEGLVEMALGQLGEARLLEGDPSPVSERGLPRRDAIRRVGLGAAILLPLVTSILAPTPAEAAATCVVGDAGCASETDGTPCTCTVPPCLGACVGGGCNLGPC